MAKRKFIEGQILDEKIIKEVFRNTSCSHYLITFTDGSHKISNFK
jgi:hypothetical protein